MNNEIAAALKDVREIIERTRSGIYELEAKIPRVAYDDVGALATSMNADLDSLEEDVKAIESQLADAKPVAREREWQRCNLCSSIQDEQNTECVYCGSDENLMYPFEPMDGDIFREFTPSDLPLADAKPSIMKIMAEYKSACDRLGYNRSDYGLAQFVVDYISHPPTAHLAGPGDEEQYSSLVEGQFSGVFESFRRPDEFGHCLAFRSNEDRAAFYKAALRTPAVPAGVTMLQLCEAVVDLAASCRENNVELVLNALGLANCKHAKAIAAAQEIVGKQ